MLRVPCQSIQELLETGRARGVKIGENGRVLGRDLLRLPSADELADVEPTRSLLLLSQPAFTKVWDNDEDSVYNDL